MSRLKTNYKHLRFVWDRDQSFYRVEYLNGCSCGKVWKRGEHLWLFRTSPNDAVAADESADITAFLRQLEEGEK